MKLPTAPGGSGPRFSRHRGIAAFLPDGIVDCDAIAPTDSTTKPDRSPAQRAFESLRYDADGTENPDFVLNREPYRGASILLTSGTFGTGEEPEAALARLLAFGVRAVVAPDFGPEFYAAAVATGLLPAALEPERIEEIARQVSSDPSRELTIDLDSEVIDYPDMEPLPFGIHPRARNKLLFGLDDLDEIRQHLGNAMAFRAADRNRRPWIYDRGEQEGEPT